jgi:hypothetical protein
MTTKLEAFIADAKANLALASNTQDTVNAERRAAFSHDDHATVAQLDQKIAAQSKQVAAAEERLSELAALLPDPTLPLTPPERMVFGARSTRHPVLGFPIETGHGAGPVNAQAANHCDKIERQEGKDVADEYRKQLGLIS